MDVKPAAGGPTYRTKIFVRYGHPEDTAYEKRRRLLDGEVVPVRCDQKRQEAKLDFDDPALRKPQPTVDTAFLAAAAAPPGTPAPDAAGSRELAEALGSGPIADILAQVVRDPEGFRAQAEAQGSGAAAFVVTDAGLAAVGPTSGRQQIDVADQLTKLAALRDSGVLTEAEFEAQKQKLLGT